MTRRGFLTLPAVLAMQLDVTGLRVSGRLTDDASDLQVGYFALCGISTGQCRSTDAIGISVHPNNNTFLKPLQSMVGQDVTVSIVPR